MQGPQKAAIFFAVLYGVSWIVMFAWAAGSIAATRGRSRGLWTALALVFGPGAAIAVYLAPPARRFAPVIPGLKTGRYAGIQLPGG